MIKCSLCSILGIPVQMFYVESYRKISLSITCTVGAIKKCTFCFLKTFVILYSNYGFTTGQSTKR